MTAAALPDSKSARDAGLTLPLLVVVLTLAILGLVILGARHLINERTRGQIADRDAHLFYTLWASQQMTPATRIFKGTVSDDPQGHLESLLEASNLLEPKQILAARLFGPNGGDSVVNFPRNISGVSLGGEELAELRQFKPFSRFEPAAHLSDLLLPGSADHWNDGETVPFLSVYIPLQLSEHGDLYGFAELVFDGKGIAEELATLDHRLAPLAWGAFLGGGALMTLAILFAFRRLQTSNRLLSERTKNLLEANQELALAAKTSAVGALSAHLIHGLRNPLSGLQSFMAMRDPAPDQGGDTEWQVAVRSTRRMQNLISEVVRVLSEENGASTYEVSLQELAAMAIAKITPMADQAGVRIHTDVAAGGILANREANLIMMILENLLTNGIQATPRGREVFLNFVSRGGVVVCEVRDEGPGVEPDRLTQLFKPCRSSKEGGSGIGLAISKQLAGSIEASLVMTRSGPDGSVFELALPARLFVANREAAFMARE